MKYKQVWKLHDFEHAFCGKGALFFSERGPTISHLLDYIPSVPLSYKYLCKECGRIYAEIETLHPDTIWTAQNSYCKRHGNGTIIPSYKEGWWDHAPYGVLLNDFLLMEFRSNHYLRM